MQLFCSTADVQLSKVCTNVLNLKPLAHSANDYSQLYRSKCIYIKELKNVSST